MYPQLPIDSIVSSYSGAMAWLHNATSRNITVIGRPVATGCPNDSGYDHLNKKAFNIYNPSNPFSLTTATVIPSLGINGILNQPFSGGQTCPICQGKGELYSPISGTVLARIKWTNKDVQPFLNGEKMQIPDSDVRIKVTGLADVALLDRAIQVFIDGTPCRPSADKIPVGLRDVHTYLYHFKKVS